MLPHTHKSIQPGFPHMSTCLRTRTLELLSGRETSLREIAEGSGVNENWLNYFFYQKIEDPSVVKVQAVYEYLTGESLL